MIHLAAIAAPIGEAHVGRPSPAKRFETFGPAERHRQPTLECEEQYLAGPVTTTLSLPSRVLDPSPRTQTEGFPL